MSHKWMLCQITLQRITLECILDKNSRKKSQIKHLIQNYFERIQSAYVASVKSSY